MYYDEKDYLEALEVYEKAEADAEKVKQEIFSEGRGRLPLRSISDEDIAIMDKAHEAWDKIIEIFRRPNRPE